MNKIQRAVTLAGVGMALLLGTSNVAAQENERQRGNFDPDQMRQRMMERYREILEIKSDEEWKIISDRVQKVMEARRDAGTGFGGGFAFGRPPGGRGGDNAAGGDRPRGDRGRGFGREQGGAAQELQQALEAKASNDQIKAKLAKLREERAQKQKQLEKTQEELKAVLSVRQEAAAVMMGLLN